MVITNMTCDVDVWIRSEYPRYLGHGSMRLAPGEVNTLTVYSNDFVRLRSFSVDSDAPTKIRVAGFIAAGLPRHIKPSAPPPQFEGSSGIWHVFEPLVSVSPGCSLSIQIENVDTVEHSVSGGTFVDEAQLDFVKLLLEKVADLQLSVDDLNLTTAFDGLGSVVIPARVDASGDVNRFGDHGAHHAFVSDTINRNCLVTSLVLQVDQPRVSVESVTLAGFPINIGCRSTPSSMFLDASECAGPRGFVFDPPRFLFVGQQVRVNLVNEGNAEAHVIAGLHTKESSVRSDKLFELIGNPWLPDR